MVREDGEKNERVGRAEGREGGREAGREVVKEGRKEREGPWKEL